MKSKIAKLLIVVTTIFSISINIILPTYAVNICDTEAPGDIKAASGCPSDSQPGNLKDTTLKIINSVITVTSIIAVIAIIIGGIQYMTSTGDPGKVKKAKDTILYAIIGLIICALSAVIVNFVISSINNPNNQEGGQNGYYQNSSHS